MKMPAIKQKVDDLAMYTIRAAEIKGKIEELKAYFKQLATTELADTKLKTVEYWGSQNARVSVSNSQTVKPVSMTAMGEYAVGKLDDLIKQITADIQIQKTLRKKLKGKYEKDTVTLMTTAGLDEKQASDWAYLAAEVINWEWLVQILQAAKWNGETTKAIEVIKSAIIVDEGIKVTVSYEDNQCNHTVPPSKVQYNEDGSVEIINGILGYFRSSDIKFDKHKRRATVSFKVENVATKIQLSIDPIDEKS